MSPISRRAGVLRTVGLDVLGPLLLYRVCSQAGVPQVWALVVSGSPPALGVLMDWLRWRTLEVMGALVLGGIGLSIVLAILSDDPKVVLLEGAAMTAGFGLVCLVSQTRRRPLIFHFAQAFYGGRHSSEGAALDAGYDRYREARFFWRTTTGVWGIAYVVEAAVLYVVVRTLPTGTALTFNRTMPWLVSGVLFVWVFWWGARVRDQNSEDEAGATTDPDIGG